MFLSQMDNQGRKIRVFRLSDSFIMKFKGKKPNWGPMGEFTYKRSYARELEDGSSEEWYQTVKRVVEGTYTVQKQHCKTLGLPWDDRKAQSSAQEMYERMFSFKFLPPGRGLWCMGTEMVYTKGGAALNNCAFRTTENLDSEFIKPFLFLMDMSMYGVGVGSDCKGAGKVKLHTPDISEEKYTVEDSREGWVNSVQIILNAFVKKGKLPKSFDYSQIRKKGSPIAGFGGTASGPGPLQELHKNLIKLLMPETEEGSWITSTQIVDIFNYMGKCVVSGGVRRTAEIMFGDQNDEEFISLKQDKEALMDRRWASNNSIFAELGMSYDKFEKPIRDNGEPGLIWLENMRNYGRMSEPPNYKDRRAKGSNPCSEQTLEDGELCCLVETFPAHHETLEDYKRTLKFAYLYGKSVTLIPTHNQRTNAIMMRNRRIGCSMSGITQTIAKLGRHEFIEWCDKGYKYIKDLDRTYSDWLCIPRSIKMTSVKPSGTVSLLAGATPGIHYPHSEYYIRRIRVQDTSPLIKACKDAGLKVEKDLYATDTLCIEFPIKESFFTKGKSDVTIWEQFNLAADLQAYWADNQVSVTITFKKEEGADVTSCLQAFERKLKSVSLLPISEHGYSQAPYESITKESYEKLIKNLKPIDFSQSKHEVTEKFCDGDQCVL